MIGYRGRPSPTFEPVQALERDLQDQLSGYDSVVECRIASCKEDSLVRQVFVSDVFLYDFIADKEVLHVLDQRNNAKCSWERTRLPSPLRCGH